MAPERRHCSAENGICHRPGAPSPDGRIVPDAPPEAIGVRARKPIEQTAEAALLTALRLSGTKTEMVAGIRSGCQASATDEGLIRMRKRKRHSAEFRAQVAVGAIREAADLAKEHHIHPAMIAG